MNTLDTLPSPFSIQTDRYRSQYDRLDNYNDINALQSIKYQSKKDKDSALDAAAKHFESLFVSMMIKSMRDANKVFSEGNMLQSNESEFYQQMFDSQLAVSLSTGRGIGLAEVIKRQMSKDTSIPHLDIPPAGLPLHGAKRQNLDATEKHAFSLENYVRLPFVSSQKAQAMAETTQKIDQLLAELPDQQTLNNVTATPEFTTRPLEMPQKFDAPKAFINALYPLAKAVESKTGIDARLMLAQSALETGWGKRPILKEDGTPSFNLFGIKANAGWKGDSASITTTEYRGGIAMKEQASFRSYANYEDSFQDYAEFLQSNQRYQEALNYSDQPKRFAQELQEAGYATDPNYAKKISKIVDRYFEDIQSVSKDNVFSGKEG